MEYTKTKKISLKSSEFSEKQIQDIINDDPSILGLGELQVYQKERLQSSGGRIDFLMANEDSSVMYEVEIMLGDLDESHIIRTIEYWDIERRRFPSREHKAVIVAENITNRFFNVIALMNKSIPIIAIQLDSFAYENKLFLNFVKVLDIYETSEEDNDIPVQTVTRETWEKDVAQKSMQLFDKVLKTLEEQHGQLKVTYNKYHIAVGTQVRNFVWFYPRKTPDYMTVDLKPLKQDFEKVENLINTLDIVPTIRKDKYISFSLKNKFWEDNKEILINVFNTIIESLK